MQIQAPHAEALAAAVVWPSLCAPRLARPNSNNLRGHGATSPTLLPLEVPLKKCPPVQSIIRPWLRLSLGRLMLVPRVLRLDLSPLPSLPHPSLLLSSLSRSPSSCQISPSVPDFFSNPQVGEKGRTFSSYFSLQRSLSKDQTSPRPAGSTRPSVA